MGYVKQRQVRSKDEIRFFRWRLWQQRMGPLPGRKDMDKLRREAERDLRRNARQLGV